MKNVVEFRVNIFYCTYFEANFWYKSKFLFVKILLTQKKGNVCTYNLRIFV